MRIAFDLDGVLRDLNGYLSKTRKCPYPTKWDASYNGKTIYECINENLEILTIAPPTAYLEVVKKHFECVEIWTSQPEHWRFHTVQWIERYIGIEGKSRVFFREGHEKQAFAKAEQVILFEDSPNFTSYEDIILIDRPYNQGVRGAMRVFGPRHLNNLIELLKGRST